MRKIREVLRLHHESQLSKRQIARSCQISRATVNEYLRRAVRAGVSWPIPEDQEEVALERQLFPLAEEEAAVYGDHLRIPLDTKYIHRELHRSKYVTLRLLWEEYKKEHPDGYQYSQYCYLYQQWNRKLPVTMRREHKGGDKLFVDYAGPSLSIYPPATGEEKSACLFVAVMGASSYTYAEATWSQELPHWIGSHVRAFEYFGGVAACLVPDNLRSGVSRACWYDPDLNPTYQSLAEHYGTAVLPARARKPRYKAKVEAGVLLAERWILAALRHQTFGDLASLNQRIGELLHKLNHRKFQRLDVSRAELFRTLDQPALRPLPSEPYRLEKIKSARVHIDYHVELEGHYYSVPYWLVHEIVEARITVSTIEILHRGNRVASHLRSFLKGKHTTCEAHRPLHHQKKNLEWTPERICRWGETFGPHTAAMAQAIMDSRSYPEQGYRACLGLLRLGERFGKERLEAACRRGLDLGSCSFRSVRSILEQGLDRQSLEPESDSAAHQLVHDNVRGAAYYQEKEAGHAAGTNL
jgi:transposase